MTTRFCTNCQSIKDIEGGIFRKTSKTGRWICKPCAEHKTESIYMSKTGRVADVKYIMNKLYNKVAA